MKLAFQTLCVALFLVSCQKTLTPEKESSGITVVSEANSPLKSHSLTFTSDYPVKAGEVPPFSYTKTLYSDHRVKSIRMLSRKYPIHPAFPKQAIELIGTFTYSDYSQFAPPVGPSAVLTGTKEVWEYYKLPNGTGARKSISKVNIKQHFTFNSQGQCVFVFGLDGDGTPEDDQYQAYGYPNYNMMDAYGPFEMIHIRDQQHVLWTDFDVVRDQYGNVLTFKPNPNNPIPNPSTFNITYDYSAPRGSKNYSFIPTQNLITPEYSLLEVMQWLPQPTHQRKAASGTFYLPGGTKVTQSQVYQNYKFDANGNQTSLTYGDNVLQKTTWDVQP